MRKIIFAGVAVFFILLGGFFMYLTCNYEVPILMYHAVDAAKVGTYSAVSPLVFKRQMSSIQEGGYRVISLSEYCRAIQEGLALGRRVVVLTFDDGLACNREADRLLDQFGFGATFFIIAGKIGESGYLNEADIRTMLSEGATEIGSHTFSEAYLPQTAQNDLAKEIIGSRNYLRNLFNRPVDTFSYTIGGFDKRVLKSVGEADYICACTTNRGFSRDINPYALRRIKITERDLGIRLWAKLSGFYNIFKRPKKPY